jgi:hypothetical protein
LSGRPSNDLWPVCESPFCAMAMAMDLDDGGSTMAYSMSGSSEQASKSRRKTSALTRSRYRLTTVFHLPKHGGRSRHGLPARTIQSHGFYKPPIVTAGPPGIGRLAEAMRLHFRPLGISQHESVHSKLESQSSSRWNPESESQQALDHRMR